MNLSSLIPIEDSQGRFDEEILSLAKTVYHHNCLNNSFYDEWTTRRFSANEFSLFSVNYFTRVHATTKRVAIALTSISDWISRLEILHNLNDELGHGVAENVHVLILKRWIDAISFKLGLPDLCEQLENKPILHSTEDFILKTNTICSKDNLYASGALLAQEWNGYTQLSLLYEGSLKYKSEFDLDEFHDINEYFYVHLGRAEKEHKIQATVIASRNCQSKDDFLKIKDGFEYYLNLLDRFWGSIADELSL